MAAVLSPSSVKQSAARCWVLDRLLVALFLDQDVGQQERGPTALPAFLGGGFQELAQLVAHHMGFGVGMDEIAQPGMAIAHQIIAGVKADQRFEQMDRALSRGFQGGFQPLDFLIGGRIAIIAEQPELLVTRTGADQGGVGGHGGGPHLALGLKFPQGTALVVGDHHPPVEAAAGGEQTVLGNGDAADRPLGDGGRSLP